MMTVAEMIECAKKVQSLCADDNAPSPLADAVLELLADDVTCGYERAVGFPEFEGSPIVDVPSSWGGTRSPADARAMARMLLRAADEAERRCDHARAVWVTRFATMLEGAKAIGLQQKPHHKWCADCQSVVEYAPGAGPKSGAN